MSYDNHDETCYILQGDATFLLGDLEEKVKTGDFVFVPRGTVFALWIDSKDGMRSLIWHNPSGIIESSLPLLGGKEAIDRTKPPDNIERPKLDMDVFMGLARATAIRILAVPDPLKQ